MNIRDNKPPRDWQVKFYNSCEWKNLRKYVQHRDNGICQICGKLIINDKWICDHIIEITNDNKEDISVILNDKNIQLLCIGCHNKKTFEVKRELRTEFDFHERDKLI